MLSFRLCTVVMLVAVFCYRQAFGYRVDLAKEQQPSDDVNWKTIDFVTPSKYLTLHEYLNRLRAEDDGHSGHLHRNYQLVDGHRLKRSISIANQPNSAEATLNSILLPDMLDPSNELFTEQLLNSPLSQLDMELIENTPGLKRLLIRNPNNQSLMFYVQEKRNNRDYNPRLGRRSADDSSEFPHQNYAPRLGKKDMHFTPRLGRDSSSG